MPTIFWNVDADGDWADSADWSLGRLPNSTDDVAIDTAGFHTVTHSVGADTVHTLTVGNDDFVVSGGSLTFKSTASFANLLTVHGGTLKLGGPATAASFLQDGGKLSGAGSLTVTGAASFQGDQLQIGPGATVLQGASTFIDGKLYLDGGRVLENQGAFTSARESFGVNQIILGSVLGGGLLKNDAGATMDLDETGVSGVAGANSFINEGTLDIRKAGINVNFTNTGDIMIGKELGFNGGTSDFRGRVSGHGSLSFIGGAQAIEAGAKITIADWLVTRAIGSTSETVLVNETLTYAGEFNQLSGTVITIAAGDTLKLTGVGNLFGTIDGAGKVRVTNGSLDGFSLGGTATLNVVGTVEQSFADTVLGVGDSAGATLRIAAGATYRLFADSNIERGRSRASTIENSGLFIKSGETGTSVVAVEIRNGGTIEAATGTLDFTQAIRGDGVLTIDAGATLEVGRSAAAAMSLTFNGGDGVLALGEPARFKATIGGFADTDAIDLVDTVATTIRRGAGGALVVRNGSVTVAVLRLAGDYTGARFHLKPDGAGGTRITVALPGAASPPAPAASAVAGHRFAAAMAGLGAGDHGPAPTSTQPHADAWRPLLSGPRSVHFA